MEMTLEAFLLQLEEKGASVYYLKEEDFSNDSSLMCLGAICLQKERPSLLYQRFWNINLSSDASFRLMEVESSLVNGKAVALIFRQFTTSRFQDEPEDILVGWVEASRGVEIVSWYHQLQGLLEKHLSARK